MAFPALYSVCLDVLICSEHHMMYILENIPIPNKIHKDLFVHAATSVTRLNANIKSVVALLVSTWPEGRLALADLFPDRQLSIVLQNSLMRTGCSDTVVDMVLSGLLNMTPQSKLRVVNFCGTSVPKVFQLPILSLPATQRLSEQLIDNVTDQCESFAEDGDNMESVLSWKLTELRNKPDDNHYQGNVPLEIHLESKLNLTDWVAMVDEIVGLCTQDLSPYRFKFIKLSVDNYHMKESEHLKWFLSNIDIKALSEIYIYGKARSMRLLMLDMEEHLARLPNLLSFGLGTTGPKIESQLVSPHEPSTHEVMGKCVKVLNHWDKLEVLQIVGMVTTGLLSVWLEALRKPLKKISFYACKLSHEDLVYLASSHHLPGLKQLGLEKNPLRGCHRSICDVIMNAPGLELLNLRETSLMQHEKLAILSSLCEYGKVETLALYEKEDMLSTSGYQEVVELACAIKTLKSFYVFPFNYRPFEVFYRESVQEACDTIRSINNRTDLQLYY